MFELLIIALFLWIFFVSIRMMFHMAWGLAKILAVVLFIAALPTLIGCLLYASGILLLLPVAIIATAWGILRSRSN